MRRKGIFVLIVVVLGVLAYNYVYQDHRNISEEKPDFEIVSTEIAAQFSSESQTSEQKYIDKTIQVSGTITELNTSDITLTMVFFANLKQ